MTTATVVKSNGHHETSIAPLNQEVITAYNPATGERIGEVPIATLDDIKTSMELARQAQKRWAALPLDDRLEKIRAIKRAFYHHHEALVDILVKEIGKVRHEALIELLPSMAVIDYYLKQSKKVLQSETRFVSLLPQRRHTRTYRPYGVVLVISPWNFPIWLSLPQIIAALVAGNSVILKPSEYATQSSEMLKTIFAAANLPDGVFQVIHGYGNVGAGLIEALPNKICFTGSEPTGRKIGAKAGELLIPVTLELGGKDAAIVLEDANIKRTARGLVWGGMHNAGQACMSVERVYVMRSIADKLVEEMKHVVEKHVSTGPGDDPQFTYGAITTPSQIEIVERHVQEAIENGAKAVVGGKRVAGNGRFYEPTILTNVTSDMAVVCQETFGPVIVVVPVDSEEEAIRLNNDSDYGLTASIWTEDQKRAKRIAEKLEVGVTSINEHILSGNAPQLPWGGIKASGFGKTRAEDGLLAMTIPHAQSAERFRLPIEIFWLPYTPLKRDLVERFVHLWFGPSLSEKAKAFDLRKKKR